MEPRQVKSAADARAIVERANLPHVKVGVFDIDGIMRGKYMSREKFLSALESGFGFCDVVLGWDCQDQLYDNVKFTGWHTGYPGRAGAHAARLLPAAAVRGRGLFFLGEFAAPAETVCPRATAAPGARARPRAGFRGVRRLRVRVLRLQGDAGIGAREELPGSHADGAGLVRLLGDPQQRGQRFLPRDARHLARRWTSASRACTRRPAPA